MSQRAVSKEVPRIVAGGGDGTLNKLANAILAAKNPGIETGLIPLGAANAIGVLLDTR